MVGEIRPSKIMEEPMSKKRLTLQQKRMIALEREHKLNIKYGLTFEAKKKVEIENKRKSL